MLHSEFKGTKPTRTGLEKESVSVKEYTEEKTIVTFEKMWLVISSESPFLAASPDGKITDHNGNSGLIEIRNILYNKPVPLTQATKMKSVKNFCLEIYKKTNKLQLKRQQNYYYQCL